MDPERTLQIVRDLAEGRARREPGKPGRPARPYVERPALVARAGQAIDWEAAADALRRQREYEAQFARPEKPVLPLPGESPGVPSESPGIPESTLLGSDRPRNAVELAGKSWWRQAVTRSAELPA